MTDGLAAAAVLDRVAVLLEAGVEPARAWGFLAEQGDADAVAVAAGLGSGQRAGPLLAERGGAWTEVAAAWRIAETVGAPLAPSLRGFAGALRDAQRTRDDVLVALADPAATARLVSWLPVVAVVLSIALGFDILTALTQPVGAVLVVAGVALMVAARLWSSRLVARARPGDEIPGLHAELVAIALSGGVSLDRAVEVVASGGTGQLDEATRGVLALSRRAGAPAVALLRAAAGDARHERRTEGRLAAARLSSRLLLPMGLCTLPAFLLLGVGPMLLSVLSGSPPPL